MKTLILALSLISLNSMASPVTAYSCNAHCLNVDWSGHDIFSLGTMEGLNKDKRRAFNDLTNKCSKRLARYGLRGRTYLAQGDFSAFHHRTTLEEGSSYAEASAVSSWRYAAAYATSSSSWRIQTEEQMNVSMSLASPQNSCEQVEVDETELVPYYEGPQIILG